MEFFKNEEFCHNFLKNMFWGEGRENKICPICGSNHVHEFKDYKKNRCYDCKFEFSIRKNTIFDDSRVSLRKWCMVIFLANSSKKGVNSHAVARQVGITQKTAWFMLQRIKNASGVATFNDKLSDTVEVDEAYLGAKEGNKHTNTKGLVDKTPVIGMVNRETKQVKAMKSPTAEKDFYFLKLI